MSNLNAALWYIRHEWRVFAITALGKKPITSNGYHDATTDEGTVRRWWEQWPDANIALACKPSGFIALDGDPSHMLDGGEFMERLLHDHPTVAQTTPTLGYHFLYLLPETTELNNSPGTLPTGIDVRVNGYILLAPSSVQYVGDQAAAKDVPDGHVGTYDWIVGHKPSEIGPQPLPDSILEMLLAKGKKDWARNNGNQKVTDNQPDAQRYAERALDYELDRLARTPQGERNNQLNISAFSLGQLVAAGALDETVVMEKLAIVAETNGLDPREIQRTIESGMKAGKLEPREIPAAPRLIFSNGTGESNGVEDLPPDIIYKAEDGGILDVWLTLYGSGWLFVNGFESWHYWTGTHWQPDECQKINGQIQSLMQQLNDEARKRKREAGDDKDAAAVAKAYIAATKRSRSRVASIEGMAQTHRGIRPSDLNAGNVLNLQNGILDLDTFEMQPHDQERAITYCLPYEYDPNAACPRFRNFIYEVLVEEGTADPDLDLIQLFQELVGYTLTTDTKHELMVWLAGEGGNGKTVAISILRELLGGMAGNVDFQTLGVAGNYDLAGLPGKRLVFSTESRRGGHIAEELLRRIVSGERINARPIWGKPFEFDPVAKIWWAMNDKPIIKDTSNATWRRLKLIPFNRTFSENEKDIHLIDKLRMELPGILNWALAGLQRLREQGKFSPAAASEIAATEYRRESNPIVQWLEECTSKSPDNLFPTRSSTAYANYKAWCENNGRTPYNSTNFGSEIKRAGIPAKRTKKGVYLDLAIDDD